MYRTLSLMALLTLIVVGCKNQSLPGKPSGADDRVAEVSIQTPDDAAEDATHDEILRSVSALYERAKQAGATQATSAKQWLAETLQQATDTGEATAVQSAEWVSELYEQAKSTGQTTAGNTKDWVLEDIHKMASWQYKTASFGPGEAEIDKRLNKLGGERWECFFVDRREDQTTFYFKRPARSYLKQIPAKELLRLIPLLGGGDSAE